MLKLTHYHPVRRFVSRRQLDYDGGRISMMDECMLAARAAPDGYTLMVTTNTTHAAALGLFKNVPYDPVKDFTAIAQIGIFRSVIAVNPNLPVRTIGELVSYAKANPGKLEYGQGNGTTQVVFLLILRREIPTRSPRRRGQSERPGKRGRASWRS